MALKSVNYFLLLLLFTAINSCSSQEEESFPDPKGLDKISNLIYAEDYSDWNNLYNDMEVLLKQQKFDSVQELLTKYKTRFSDKGKEMQFFQGVVYFGKNDLEKAKEQFSALNEKPSPEVSLYLGHIYRKERNYKLALKHYEKSLSLLGNANIYTSLADLYYEMKNFDQAAAFYQKSIALSADSYLDRYFLANIYFTQGKLMESEKLLHEVIKLKPNFKKAYVGLFAVYDKRKNKLESLYYQARAHLLDMDYKAVVRKFEKEKIILKEPKTLKIYIVALLKEGLIDKAQKIIASALQKFPKDTDILMYNGMLLVINNDPHKANLYFKDLYEQYPHVFNIVVSYADSLLDQKKDQEAIELYEKALLLEENNIQYRHKLAEIYRKSNQDEKDLYHRGILYLYQGQLNEAFEVLVRIKKPVNEPVYYFYLGKAYLEKNNLEEAEKAFLKAIEFKKDFYKPYLDLTFLYLKQNQKDKAKKLLGSYPETNEQIKEMLQFVEKQKN